MGLVTLHDHGTKLRCAKHFQKRPVDEGIVWCQSGWQMKTVAETSLFYQFFFSFHLSIFLIYVSFLSIYPSFHLSVFLSVSISLSLFFLSLSLSRFVFKCIYIYTCIWWCVILWCMMCEKCCIVENINLGEKVPSKSLYIYISIPSGKQPHNYGKLPFLMGKSTISMAIFNSKLFVYQKSHQTWDRRLAAHPTPQWGSERSSRHLSRYHRFGNLMGMGQNPGT